MAQNKSVTEETFGKDVTNPKLTKGKMEAIGHTVKDGQPIPDRGTSPNVKTGFPANDKK